MKPRTGYYLSPQTIRRMRDPIEASPFAIDLADLMDAYEVAEQTGQTPRQVVQIAAKSGGRIGRKARTGLNGRYYFSRDDVRRIREARP